MNNQNNAVVVVRSVYIKSNLNDNDNIDGFFYLALQNYIMDTDVVAYVYLKGAKHSIFYIVCVFV